MANIVIYVFAFVITPCFCTASSNLISPERNATVWRNTKQFNNTVHLSDGSKARFIKLRNGATSSFIKYGYAFGFGFYCRHENGHLCELAILFLDIKNNTFPGTYQKVWSANASRHVNENATLELASDGNMILKDAKGREVWRSNTTGQILTHLDITTAGNTRLFNRANEIVWQSFEHPTDTLLVGQRLNITQQLMSIHNLFNLKIRYNEIRAYAYGRRQVKYFSFAPSQVPQHIYHNSSLISFQFRKGSIAFMYKTATRYREYFFQIPITTSQFFRVDQDGGLRIYGWEPNHGWKVIYVFGWDECAFPLKCGKYGVCLGGQCTCPVANDGIQYFKPIDSRQPNLGCEHSVFPLDQSDTFSQLVNFKGLSYSTFYCDDETVVEGIENEEECKQACSTNTTCKAVLHRPSEENAASGTCFLITNILTIIGTSVENSLEKMFIVVPTPAFKPHSRKIKHLKLLLATHLSTLLVVAFGVLSVLLVKKQRACKTVDTLLHIEGLSETPVRFSCRKLREATKNFSHAIGEGGFGVVYKGVLENRMMVAVKQLKKVGQGMDEFIAEMETLGTIHHINLVTLVGFCADKKGNRMLVYELMDKGSLDKWIFNCKPDSYLSWNMKKKILLDIAKGLAYLHHECRHKIAHLDIKPQNILLDENFNAKISDFGTSKLINRNESEVVTRVRGTLGYLAPEWQNGNITVKADTYSFGIVILEVITNRKILDYSLQPEHLLTLLQNKVAENRVMDIVEKYCSDLELESDREAVVTIMQLGMWCLNISYTKRPAMSLVVKILESVVNPETHCSIPVRTMAAFGCPGSKSTMSLIL